MIIFSKNYSIQVMKCKLQCVHDIDYLSLVVYIRSSDLQNAKNKDSVLERMVSIR